MVLLPLFITFFRKHFGIYLFICLFTYFMRMEVREQLVLSLHSAGSENQSQVIRLPTEPFCRRTHTLVFFKNPSLLPSSLFTSHASFYFHIFLCCFSDPWFHIWEKPCAACLWPGIVHLAWFLELCNWEPLCVPGFYNEHFTAHVLLYNCLSLHSNHPWSLSDQCDSKPACQCAPGSRSGWLCPLKTIICLQGFQPSS